MVVEFELHYVPASFNELAYAHWRKRSKAKADLQGDLESMLMALRLPRGLTHVYAGAVLRFPVHRVRDEGNFRAPLEKALGDALTSGRWLLDDDHEHFTFGRVRFDEDRGPARTTIHLRTTP